MLYDALNVFVSLGIVVVAGLLVIPWILEFLGFVLGLLSETAGWIVGLLATSPLPETKAAWVSAPAVPAPAPPIGLKRKQTPRGVNRIRVKFGRIPPLPMTGHLDECCSSRSLFQSLIQAGCSVSRTIGDLNGITDEQQIEFARSRRAILVTHDKLLFEGCDKQGHCGVVWAPSGFDEGVLSNYLVKLMRRSDVGGRS